MIQSSDSAKPLIAMAGASGFVGTHLQIALQDNFRFRALTRSPNIVEEHRSESSTEWRHCDLYSLPKVTEALKGCDIGLYLVHSMAPSSRLIQGNFADMDLLLADNFVRASEAAGIQHIIYLSGLIPNQEEGISPHLASRLEVETVLRSRSIKITVLRAGLIFGPGGSSFSMLVNLVRRLPVMLLPRWANSRTHSIDIDDICRAFRFCLMDESLAGATFDLGGHSPMTYKELILKTSRLMGKQTITVDLPLNLFYLSRHWVAVFGRVSSSLVGPLQESLQHDLNAAPNLLLERMRDSLVPLERSMAKAVDDRGNPRPNPRKKTERVDQRQIKRARQVRSVQRMSLPKNWDAAIVSREYSNWLSQSFGWFINASTDRAGVVRFYALGHWLVLLELTPTPYTLTNLRRRAFYISGGILSRKVDPPGRFEFRLFPENKCIIASIHGFSPTLPWWIYEKTQAIIHLKVMKAFARYLKGVTKV